MDATLDGSIEERPSAAGSKITLSDGTLDVGGRLNLYGSSNGAAIRGSGKVIVHSGAELVLLIIYFIFKHILLAQNRPESDADGSEVTESLSVIPFQVLSNWKIPDSSSLPFSDNSKLLHPDSNQENTREYVPAKHDHLLLQAKTF